jgi:hypothetical protein
VCGIVAGVVLAVVDGAVLVVVVVVGVVAAVVVVVDGSVVVGVVEVSVVVVAVDVSVAVVMLVVVAVVDVAVGSVVSAAAPRATPAATSGPAGADRASAVTRAGSRRRTAAERKRRCIVLGVSEPHLSPLRVNADSSLGRWQQRRLSQSQTGLSYFLSTSLACDRDCSLPLQTCRGVRGPLSLADCFPVIEDMVAASSAPAGLLTSEASPPHAQFGRWAGMPPLWPTSGMPLMAW